MDCQTAEKHWQTAEKQPSENKWRVGGSRLASAGSIIKRKILLHVIQPHVATNDNKRSSLVIAGRPRSRHHNSVVLDWIYRSGYFLFIFTGLNFRLSSLPGNLQGLMQGRRRRNGLTRVSMYNHWHPLRKISPGLQWSTNIRPGGKYPLLTCVNAIAG